LALAFFFRDCFFTFSVERSFFTFSFDRFLFTFSLERKSNKKFKRVPRLRARGGQGCGTALRSNFHPAELAFGTFILIHQLNDEVDAACYAELHGGAVFICCVIILTE
jgi:hypothetical protein